MAPIKIGRYIVVVALSARLALSNSANGDEIDDYIAAQMGRLHIPGVSLAILRDVFRTNLAFETAAGRNELLKMFFKLPLEFQPGESWAYDNTGLLSARHYHREGKRQILLAIFGRADLQAAWYERNTQHRSATNRSQPRFRL